MCVRSGGVQLPLVIGHLPLPSARESMRTHNLRLIKLGESRPRDRHARPGEREPVLKGLIEVGGNRSRDVHSVPSINRTAACGLSSGKAEEGGDEAEVEEHSCERRQGAARADLSE
jgi:hypothetical protein